MRPRLVDPQGRPIKRGRQASTACPHCSAKADRRVLSAGFGDPHDVCGQCGHEWPDERLAAAKKQES